MLSVFPRTDCGSSGATWTATSSMTADAPSVYARLAATAPRDLGERGGGRAAVLGAVAMPDREVVPQEPFGSGWSGRRRAQVLALLRGHVTCLCSPVRTTRSSPACRACGPLLRSDL